MFKVWLVRLMIHLLLDSDVVTLGAFDKWKLKQMRELYGPSSASMGLGHSHSNEEVTQGVMRRSHRLLPELLRDMLNHVRGNELFSPIKGSEPIIRSLS